MTNLNIDVAMTAGLLSFLSPCVLLIFGAILALAGISLTSTPSTLPLHGC